MKAAPVLQGGAPRIETVGMTMRFGAFTALDDVSITVEAGSFHALLGENGAGKSTLVKCIMGFYRATSGQVLVEDREAEIGDPRAARALGLGMVYQHFTLVPALTAAENLVISRPDVPAIIDWARENARLQDFMARMPFSVPLHRPVAELAAGEKQKLEILKQLYLGSRFLILDEPTSVLTPDEADEVLGHVRALCQSGRLTVLMITHKFREVASYADHVSVLRRGRLVGGGPVRSLSADALARMMIGETELAETAARSVTEAGPVMLELRDIDASDRSGLKRIRIKHLALRAGETVGVAGVSGNGQPELMEILTGQRPLEAGVVLVKGEPYAGARAQSRLAGVRCLPEEPLRNACVAGMSVAENIGFRSFDHDETGPRLWLSGRRLREIAVGLVAAFKVKTTSVDSPIASLSGGNVQRAVLARELTGQVDVLIVCNPCFGLDFSAVAEIRARIMAARNRGAAILLISEDLDEILALADRVVVMSEGRIVFETDGGEAARTEIGRHMGGHH